jgi:hypothetical protein
MSNFHSFKTRPGLAGRPGTRPIWSWNRAGLKKKQGKEKSGVTRWIDSVKNLAATRWLLFFCFYWNDVILIFLKKNWSEQPGQNSKSGFWIGSGLKTMVIFVYKNCESVAKIMGGKTACRLLKRIHLRLNQLNNPHEAAHTMWLRNGILMTSCPKNNKKR